MQSNNVNSSHKVGIIVLNWNNYSDTIRCVRTVLKQQYSNFRVYVADNGSTDGSFESLKEDINDVRVTWIENGANLGFAAGCNQGIARALSDECEYVLLFNNDCL